MKEKVTESMQKFSRAVIVPVKFMAVMGLFLAFSVIFQLNFMPSFLQSFGELVKTMMDSMLNNLSLIFCIGIASSLANKKKVEAGLTALISFLFFLAANNAWLTMNNMIAEAGTMGLYGTGQGMVLGFQVVDMNVFLGMIIGCLVGYIHNKFSNIELHDILKIYGGSRLSFMILVPIILALAIVLSYIWPVVNEGIGSMSNLILTTGLLGVFIYSFGNRFLIPTGLHHLLWMPFCFTAIGGTAEINGQVYSGAVNIFYAEMANAGTITQLDSSLRFATFGFVKIFGSIAVALAIIYCANKNKKEETKGMILPSMFVASIAGITEPLDFSFLFISPLLWLVHSLLTAVSETLLWALGARTYMLYGILDTFVSNSVFSPSVTRFYLVIIVGIVMSIIWFFIFVFLIKKFDIKTPGREAEELEAAGTITISGDAQATIQDEQLVIDGLGGPENIEMVTNCFTRLRVTVNDPVRVNKALLESLQSSKGVVINDKNIQVIIGMGVQDFKETVCEILGISE
ncbi:MULTISPECIES: PTS transporter subunit EIIC [unclassified Enterococcus]|uniref:PTS transporter subunit EIIC n=1 Tax=unclassified Enterococcus TaxID=2608891 RepID=UPI00155534DB|nr:MULTISPECIES: PTS transporter subunit EIIC [unclassified Enterococcus]MBS7578001.1 PTS transporter subunit EIIC [Enterococcus sp. MMGLQ5-2]MBS7585309.1 PTS transporter subunit EIIC [Enterococcus sp. MMGLQ5-1]NPD13166.1 PTS transporter subunit EIIC [Enterococcus sp. MMGLQ5-1]NPD37832.1 PTS transporter subunit EIIC [Enterococcus sp. MMGLQ5-2]